MDETNPAATVLTRYMEEKNRNPYASYEHHLRSLSSDFNHHAMEADLDFIDFLVDIRTHAHEHGADHHREGHH